jgi:hypothetical protein
MTQHTASDALATIRKYADSLAKTKQPSPVAKLSPHINDFDQLMEQWQATSSDIHKKHLLEARLVNIIFAIIDFDKLISMQTNTPPESRPWQFIEARLHELISAMNDFDQLMKKHEDTASNPARKEVIETRITKVIATVTTDNIPKWFVSFAEQPNTIPDFLLNAINEKARILAVK